MKLDSAIFYSNSIKEAISFYRDILGFNLEYQQGDKYVSFVFLNGARLGIKHRSEDREVPGFQTVFASVGEEIDKLYNLLKTKDVKIYSELALKSCGREFSILDPDKNKVLFIQRV
jgi:catechol 2,3-dioxygenase-like lactoylglutathione lyase family enzyme